MTFKMSLTSWKSNEIWFDENLEHEMMQDVGSK